MYHCISIVPATAQLTFLILFKMISRNIQCKIILLCLFARCSAQIIDTRCIVKQNFRIPTLPNISVSINALVRANETIFKVVVAGNTAFEYDIIELTSSQILITYSRPRMVDVWITVPVETQHSRLPQWYIFTLMLSSHGYTIKDENESTLAIVKTNNITTKITATHIYITDGFFTTGCENGNRMWLIQDMERMICCFSDEGSMNLSLFSFMKFKPIFSIGKHNFSLSLEEGTVVISNASNVGNYLPANEFIYIKFDIRNRTKLLVKINEEISTFVMNTEYSPVITVKNVEANEIFMTQVRVYETRTEAPGSDGCEYHRHPYEINAFWALLGLNIWNLLIIITVTAMLWKLHNSYKKVETSSAVVHEEIYEELNVKVSAAIKRASIFLRRKQTESDEEEYSGEENEYDTEWVVGCKQRKALEDLYERFHEMKESLDKAITDSKEQ